MPVKESCLQLVNLSPCWPDSSKMECLSESWYILDVTFS